MNIWCTVFRVGDGQLFHQEQGIDYRHWNVLIHFILETGK